MGLLKTLKPEWWFSAHMHTRFTATVEHGGVRQEPVAPLPVQNPDEIRTGDDEFESSIPTQSAHTPAMEAVECVSKNLDEITLDDEEEGVDMPPPPPPPPPPPLETKFLALDKCLPDRQFLEVIDIDDNEIQPAQSQKVTLSPISGRPQPLLSYDPEWLAITRAFHPYLSTTRHQPRLPEEAEARVLVAQAAKWVKNNIRTNEQGEIPVMDHQTFVMTAPGPGSEGPSKFQQPPCYTNPQTEAFCRMLDIPDKINPPPATNAEPTSQ